MKFVSKCIHCQRKRKTIGSALKTHRNTMRTNQGQYPMQMIYLDFYGPLHATADDYKYILTCKDAFTRFHWLIPTKSTNTNAVVEALEKEIFAYWGLPDKIVTDNAKEFTSAKMKEICEQLNITLRTVVPYNPASNSVERVHSTMGEIFRSFEKIARENWKGLVPAMNLAINSSVNRVTGFSPLFLMTGRPPRLERRILFGDTQEKDEMEVGLDCAEKMERVFEMVKKNVGKHLQYRVKEYLEDDAKKL